MFAGRPLSAVVVWCQIIATILYTARRPDGAGVIGARRLIRGAPHTRIHSRPHWRGFEGRREGTQPSLDDAT